MSKNLEGFAFLEQILDDDLLRSSARNILDSYGHAWDVLAESLQNAVDAIEMKIAKDANGTKHLRISFDCKQRAIEVSDTGIGISAEQLAVIVTPNRSLKRGVSPSLRGEKGVGLTFLVFISNHFKIETCDGIQTTSLEIQNANNWVNSEKFPQPKFEKVTFGPPSIFEGSTTFTRIWVGGIPERQDSGQDIFTYSKQRLVHVLRTKTAVGNTSPVLLGKRPDCDISVFLRYTDPKGVPESEDRVVYSYASPDTYLKANAVVEWSRYQQLLTERKEKSVAGKALVRVGTSTSDGGRQIKWYVFAASRRTFDSISEMHGLVSDETHDIEGGSYLSTKGGMPTGVQITPPKSGQAAYWPSLYILIEYDYINWDVGRKFVGGRTLEMLKKAILKDIFNPIVDHLSAFIAGSTPVLQGLENQSQLDELRKNALARADLDLSAVPYLKQPGEEQGVVALFHELLGAKVIKRYSTYGNYGKDRYDSFIRVEGPNGKTYDIFSEFKYEASSVLADFLDKKRPRDIRLLICWSINEKKFEAEGFDIEHIDEDDKPVFHGSTHKLTMPGRYLFGIDNLLWIIELKTIVQRYKASQK